MIRRVLEKMGIVEKENQALDFLGVSQRAKWLKEQYELEKSLMNRLRNSTREERRRLYGTTYDELSRRTAAAQARIPAPDRLKLVQDPYTRQRELSSQMKILKRFFSRETHFLEIGPGHCDLAFEVAKHVKKVIAIDVSKEITRPKSQPQNFELIISDGISIDVPAGTIDIAYSMNLMEHLHPDDAETQLRNVYQALAPNGIYVCLTPHRFTGPHDISRHFDEVATGCHLKEYTYNELRRVFTSAGFSRINAIAIGIVCLTVPVGVFVFLEKLVIQLPIGIQRTIRHSPLAMMITPIRVIAKK